jgi:hypothetical protein
MPLRERTTTESSNYLGREYSNKILIFKLCLGLKWITHFGITNIFLWTIQRDKLSTNKES